MVEQIFVDRLTAVRQKLPEWEVDGVLIASAINRRWLSSFTGSNGQLLITPDQALLATDFRYYEQAMAQAPHFTLFKHERTAKDTAAFIEAAGISRIGLEAEHTSLAAAAALKKVKNVKWKSLAKVIEPLRQIKAAAEIEAIRAAAAVTDRVMAQVGELARPGLSERQLAWELEKRLRESGAEAVAFPVLVASGSNSALPHHRPGDRILQPGDVIIVDMGTEVNGYKSDLTRTFYLGDEPDEQFWRIYNQVLAAQTAVFEQARPGMKLKAVDAIARDQITAAGHGDHFGHGLGHGVGLDIHEAPFLSRHAKEKERLPVGATVTIEPGIYLPGWGGVRLEELAAVAENGLTRLSRCAYTPATPAHAELSAGW